MFRLNPPRRTVKSPRSTVTSLTAALAVTLSFSAALGQSPPNVYGFWRGPFSTRNGGSFPIPLDSIQGAHDVVLRPSRSSPDPTTVLIYGSSGGHGLRFGTWTYTPATAFIAPQFSFVSEPPGGRNVFCSGHSVLPDGRLLINGGEMLRGELGSDRSYIFDPTVSQPWTLPLSHMAQFRWYPTINTLSNGQLIALSGNQYTTLLSFGGTTGSAESDFNAMWQSSVPSWKTQALLTPSSTDPKPRYGHTLTNNKFGSPEEQGVSIVTVLYGGRGTSGVYPVDSIWVLSRFSNDTTWQWTRHKPADDLSSGHPPNPGGRYRHTAILASDNAIYIYGGFDANGQALNDVWKLCLCPSWQWTFVTSGPGPGARGGHAAVFDNDHQRMLIFGGATDLGGTPASNVTWALPLNVQSPVWIAPAVSGGPPGAREGHGMVADNYETHTAPSGPEEHRAILFGGQASNTLVNENPWFLWFGTGTQSDAPIEWQQISPSGTAPTPRSYFASLYDIDFRQMTIFGGDSILVPSLVRSDQTYALGISPLQWWWLTPESGSPTPRRLSGSAIALDRRAVQARIPEIYTLPPTDTWTALEGAPRQEDNYPFTFEMTNGKLLDAGPVVDAARLGHFTELDLATGAWVDSVTESGLRGTLRMGSAVMYRPGRVLRCGSRGPDPVMIGSDQTDTLECQLGSVKGWRPIANGLTGRMNPRNEPNLTVLPTGQVLVTGGMDQNIARREPQIWSPGTAVWSPHLAQDPAIRNYHSAAILLPDARIFSSGGETATADRYNATIYDPPYLFDRNGNAITSRPSIGGVPLELKYGKTFTICSSQATTIRSACLIRPGAVTHAYNQDQRFVPLAISKATDPPRLFAKAPDFAALAPPGDYMLFVLDSTAVADSVPSVAKWVHLSTTGGLDLCDTTRAGQIIDLTFDVDPNDCTHFTLSWTAPGDDAYLTASGAASSYVMKTSSSPIGSDWTGGTVLSMLPAAPGTVQTKLIVVPGGQHLYVRIRTQDDNNNLSASSNQVHLFQQDCGGGSFAGGGGGGGLRARPMSALASPRSAELTSSSENTLLNGVVPGSKATDMLRVAPTNATNGSFAVRIREAANHRVSVDYARMLVVDHSSLVNAYVGSGEPILGNRSVPPRATDDAGTDVTPLVDGSTADGFVGDSAATINVQLGSDSSGSPDPVVIEASGLGGPSSGILVQVPDGAGSWRTVGRVHPRRYFDELVVDSVASSQVRLYLLGTHQVRFVGRVARSTEQPTVQWAQVSGAQDARIGDVRTPLMAADTSAVTISGPDTLTLSFTAPALASGQVRDCFLVVDATPFAPQATTVSPARATATASIPTRFALWQNQPNPFSALTTMRFDLPVGAMVLTCSPFQAQA